MRGAPQRLSGHVFYRPRPPLDAYVDFLWVIDGYTAAAPRERVLPSGWASMVVQLADAPMRAESATSAVATHAVVCGASTRPVLLDTTTLGASVGAQLKPGGVRALLGVSAAEVGEQLMPLAACGEAWVDELRVRLADEPTMAARAARFEHMLLARLRTADAPAPLRSALAAFERADLPSVAEVNRRTGLSAKRLLALFRDEVGLSPKAYWRVRRFRAVLRDLAGGRAGGAPLAAEHGYCDQSHFLREFRALAGSTARSRPAPTSTRASSSTCTASPSCARSAATARCSRAWSARWSACATR